TKNQRQAALEAVRAAAAPQLQPLEAQQQLAQKRLESEEKALEEHKKGMKDVRDQITQGIEQGFKGSPEVRASAENQSATAARDEEIHAANQEFEQKSAARAQHDQELQRKINDAGIDSAERSRLQQQLSESQASRESEARHQDERIREAEDKLLKTRSELLGVNQTQLVTLEKFKQADPQLVDAVSARQQEVKTGRQSIDAVEEQSGIKTAKTAVDTADNELSQFDRNYNERLKNVQDSAVNQLRTTVENIAEQVGRQYGTIWQRAIGTITGTNARVGAETKSQYKRRHANRRLRAALEQQLSDDGVTGGGGGTPADGGGGGTT
ncbi:MAG TPA: hypothetical protein VN495_02975, partial [Candidatus Paceibacterota bacterium]|nr:hypothetical protein [Candidatus Paceibacterota bacterium]